MSAKKPKKGRGTPKKSNRGFVIVAVALVGAALLAGIVAGAVVGGSGGSGGDGKIDLPDFAYLSTAPKGSVQAYQFAVDFPEYLASVPCWCGCGELDGHDSNLDCFIKGRDGDDVDFDDHASY